VVLDKSMLYDATIVIIETQMHKKISYWQILISLLKIWLSD
jgi:hypothetical protein